MKLNFKTLFAIGSLMFGSADAYLGTCNHTSLKATKEEPIGVAIFECSNRFKNLEELKIDPNNLGVLITRLEGKVRPLKEESFPKLKILEVIGSVPWEMIKQVLKYLSKLSKLIMDAPNFDEKEDAKIIKYQRNYRQKNVFNLESCAVSDEEEDTEIIEYQQNHIQSNISCAYPFCQVSVVNGRIVVEGKLTNIKDYEGEIRRICLELEKQQREKKEESAENLEKQQAGADGITPMMHAIYFDNPDAVEKLLSECSSEEIDDAMRYAIKFGSKKVGSMLLNTQDFSKEQLENFVKFACSSNEINNPMRDLIKSKVGRTFIENEDSPKKLLKDLVEYSIDLLSLNKKPKNMYRYNEVQTDSDSDTEERSSDSDSDSDTEERSSDSDSDSDTEERSSDSDSDIEE